MMEAESDNEPKPCGACLQYISDFAESPRAKVFMAKAKSGKILFETIKVKTVGELLPFPVQKIRVFRSKSVVRLKNEQSVS
jgi:cytidine deaminase